MCAPAASTTGMARTRASSQSDPAVVGQRSRCAPRPGFAILPLRSAPWSSNAPCHLADPGPAACPGGSAARAAKANAQPQDSFSELFDTACMQHIGAPARLQSLMESNGLSPLPPAEAATLLQGQPGVAWMVPLASGRYAVSWADDGTCSVYAEKADAAVVQKGFARLVQAAPKPLQARSLPGRGPCRPTRWRSSTAGPRRDRPSCMRASGW